MNIRWKMACFGMVLLSALLACSLPTGVTPATATPTLPDDPTPSSPTATNTQTSTEPADPTATTEPTASDCTADSEFVADVTIPDGTLVAPGTTVTKTWRIENDGTCTWTSGYVWEQLNFGEGELNAAARTTALTRDVAPGETYEISVALTMDPGAEVGSRQIARFQLRNPGGTLFGTHPFALVFAAPGGGTCPVGNADQLTFINVAEQFCFLYPDDYNAYIGVTGTTVVAAPPSPGVTEEILPSVSISNEGSTGGQNLNNWSNAMVNAWKVPGTTPTVTEVQVNGINARYTDELPGQVGNRIVFLVHDGDGYVFTVLPVDDAFPAKKTAALALWELVRTSFTFFGP